MTDNLTDNSKNTDQDREERRKEVSNEINTIVNQEISKRKDKEEVIIDTDAIHVMPKKFLPQSPKKQISSKQKLILIIIVFVLFLIVVIGLMLWFANKSVNQPLNNQNIVQNNTTTDQNNNQPVEVSHDAKIVSDLEKINNALRRYFSEFRVYPSSLSNLTSYFDDEIPKNPSGLSYDYQMQDLGNNFRILVEFDGSDAENRIGIYQYTKYGLTIYNAEEENNNNQVIIPPPPPPNNATSTATSTPIIPPPPTIDNLDSDRDQLTSNEEALYNTVADDDDSDNDGFKDGVEITNLDNPLSCSGSLIDSGLVSIYNSSGFNYSVFYPSDWVAQAVDDQSKNMVFLSDTETGEFISVQIFDNEFPLSLADWRSQVNVNSTWVGFALGKSQQLSAYKTTDGRHVLYVKGGSGTQAYLISYNLEQGATAHFDSTFDMMLNSFETTND